MEEKNQTQTDETVKEENVSPNGSVDTNDYIKAIKELKENSVSRADYDKVREENRALLKSIVNGDANPKDEPKVEDKETIQDLRRQIFFESENYDNLTFTKKTMKLREKLLAEGKPDIFVPESRVYHATNEDILTGQRLADCFQECIDKANGDPDVFNAELKKRSKMPIVNPNNRR